MLAGPSALHTWLAAPAGLIPRWDVEGQLAALDPSHEQWGMWMSEMFDHVEVVEQVGLNTKVTLPDMFESPKHTANTGGALETALKPNPHLPGNTMIIGSCRQPELCSLHANCLL